MVEHGNDEKVAEGAAEVVQRTVAESDRVVGAELVAPGCGSTEREEPGSWMVHQLLEECGGEVAVKLEANFGRVLFLFYFQTESPGKRKSWRRVLETCTPQEEEVVEQEVADEDEGC